MGLKDKLKNLEDELGGKEGIEDKLKDWMDRRNGGGAKNEKSSFLVVLLVILVALLAFRVMDQQQESTDAIVTDQHQESWERSKVGRKRHEGEQETEYEQNAPKIEEEEKDNLKEHREELKEEQQEPKEENASQNLEEVQRALALIETQIEGFRNDKNKAVDDDNYDEAKRLKAVIEDSDKKAQKLKTMIASKTPQEHDIHSKEGKKDLGNEPLDEHNVPEDEEAQRALALSETQIDGYRSDKNKAVDDDDYNEAKRLQAVIEDLDKETHQESRKSSKAGRQGHEYGHEAAHQQHVPEEEEAQLGKIEGEEEDFSIGRSIGKGLGRIGRSIGKSIWKSIGKGLKFTK